MQAKEKMRNGEKKKDSAPLCLRWASSARSFLVSASTAFADDDDDDDADNDAADDDGASDTPLAVAAEAAVEEEEEEDADADGPDAEVRGPRFDWSNTSFSARQTPCESGMKKHDTKSEFKRFQH